MRNKRKISQIAEGVILPVIVVLCIGLVYVYVSGRMQTSMPEISAKDGVVDATEVDFTEGVYHLVNNWDYYAGKLLWPEDFKNAETLPAKDGKDVWDYNLGTYRVVIKAKPNQYLEIASYGIDYATRVFVNGQEELNLGFVSDDPQKAVHGNRYMTYPFYTGETGEVEIIYQYCNYMHNDGGFIQATTISTPQNIDKYVRGITIFSLFTSCGLVFLAMYFLISAAHLRNRGYGVLALCCLLIAFRNQFFAFDMFLPGLDFLLQYRLTVLIVSMIPAVAYCLPAVFFPKVFRKRDVLVFTGIYLVLVVLHFTLDTHDLVLLCHICYYYCLAIAVLMVINFVRYFRKHGRPSFTDWWTIGAELVLIYTMYREGMSTGSNSLVAHYGVTPFGMLTCILILSVIVNHAIQKQALSLEEAKNKNEVLQRVNDMNRDFLQTVAHELKTPLAVISGYAQLIDMQIQKGKMSEQTSERLTTIRSEADRLGEMVSNLMAYTYGRRKDAEMGPVDTMELAKSAVAVTKPVCEKRGNKLVLTGGGCKVHGNFELLLQVLINLIVNASRHTEEGTITLAVIELADAGEFTVSDTGTGIPEESVEHVFERGYTTDGGNGLGLSICKETVGLHGGEMELVSTGDTGTTFRFTIPKEKEK
ncbi:MAG: hypothetical protein IKZ69_07075 [Lachnospiraceae bacterium]|nr:hypothetical protein [Lachnospiraceae bacterium]